MANKKDLAAGLIGGSVSTSATSIPLQTGYGAVMPSAPFFLTLTPKGQLSNYGNSEIVSVTAIATDTLTVVRAQKGTTAKTFTNGDIAVNGIYLDEVMPTQVATQETPNGVRTLYTVPGGKYKAGTLTPYVNGLAQMVTADFTETNPAAGTFTLDTVYPSTSKVTVTFQSE